MMAAMFRNFPTRSRRPIPHVNNKILVILYLSLLVLFSCQISSVTSFVVSNNNYYSTITNNSKFHVTSKQHLTPLQAIPFPNFESIDNLIYTAQSTAASLANTSMSSSPSTQSLAILYFAGLLTSFSPCSLGLLPLTMSYISTAAGEREDKAVFLPTVAYAVGLASVFCGLGLSVAFLGGVFGSSGGGSSSGNGSSLGSFFLAALGSTVSIVMGLQLLELVNIPLPSLEISSSSSETCETCSDISYNEDGSIVERKVCTRPQNKDSTNTESKSNYGGISSLIRVALLGGSSALVASPCATPVLTSILAFVAATRDPTLGALLLLIYTIGYSTPLLIVGASGGQALASAQAASSSNEESIMGKIGSLVNPLTASILITYGTNGFLEAIWGNPSLAGLAPIIE